MEGTSDKGDNRWAWVGGSADCAGTFKAGPQYAGGD